MGNFNRSGRKDYGKRSFGGNRDRGGDRDSGRLQMFRAICADCGRSCEVPFKPSGDKPVYCRDCFDKHGGGDDRKERNYNRFDSEERQMFSAVCDSCGKRCEVPFRPSSNKPIYCSDCFARKDDPDFNPSGGNKDKEEKTLNVQLKEQLDVLNGKLDRLLRALELRGKIESVVEEVEVVEEEPIIEMAPIEEVKVVKKEKAKAKKTKPKKKPAVKKEK